MTEPTSMPPPAEASVEAKKPKSKGEKFFDRVVYGGIAGVGTFFVTIGAAYSLRYGRWENHYKNAVKNLSRYVPQTAAEIGVETTALMQGGNLMVLPVLFAEKHKVPIVRGLNVMLGDTTPPEAIEQSPKQTTMSLIQGRLLAWGVVFTTLLTAFLTFRNTYDTFKNEFAQKVYGLAERFKWNKAGEAMKNAKWYRYGDLAALDIFATAAAATLLYVGGHFFARKHEEKLERKAARREQMGLPDRSEESADLLEKTDAPRSQVTGDKQAQGVMHAPVQAQAVAKV